MVLFNCDNHTNFDNFGSRSVSQPAHGFCNHSVTRISWLTFPRYIFAKFQASLNDVDLGNKALPRTIPTYLTLFIFGFLYQLVLVYDSLRLKNTIQVIGLCIYNVGMLIYAAIQYDQVDDAIKDLKKIGYINAEKAVWKDVQPYLLTVPIIISFFTVVMSLIAWKLYDEFAWTIYKHISADLRMKRRFLTFQVSKPRAKLSSHIRSMYANDNRFTLPC